MTPGERETAKKTARIIRTARKTRDITQVDAAKQLGISQSALSKMENALLIPSVYHWFSFCKLTDIPTDSHIHGYIDFGHPVEMLRDDVPGSFRLPRRYRVNQGSSVRSVLPLVNHFKKALGEKAFGEFLEQAKVDSDFFNRLDHSISLEFALDTTRALMRKGVLGPDGMKALMQTVTDPDAHGVAKTAYLGVEGSSQVLKALFSQTNLYECNFEYSVEEQARDTLSVSVKPRPHLKSMKYKDEELGDFLCRYKKLYFEHVSRLGGNKGATLHEVECHYRDGAPRCLYRVTG